MARLHLSLVLSLAACGAASDPPSLSETRTVSLITGDRVTLPPDGGPPKIAPGPGRERIGFFTARLGDRAVVIPRDVMAQVARGELDPAQFELGPAGPAAATPAAAGDTVNLHFDAVDHLGNPTSGFGVLIGGPRGFQFFHPPQTLAVIAGAPYSATLVPFEDLELLIQPRLTITEDTTVLLDGRLAQLPDLSVPGQPLAILGMQGVCVDRGGPLGTFTSSVSAPGLLRTVQLGPPPAPGDIVSYAAVDAVGLEDNAPYVFAHRENDRWMTGFRLAGTPDRMITVRAEHRATPDQTHTKATAAVLPDLGLFTLDPLASVTVQGAFTRTEHYIADAGIAWEPSLEQLDASGEVATRQGFVLAPYRAGHRYDETWNRAPFGPAFSAIDGVPRASRDGDVLTVAPTLYSEVASPSRAGASNGTQRVALLRDGVVLEEQIDEPFGVLEAIEVAAAPATYRLEAEATRPDSISDLSPSVRAVWTFRSGHTTAPEVLALPTLRFAPVLDRDNASRAGLPLVLPVHVERLPGAPTPAVRALTVEASFDDGATWRPVLGARVGSEFLGIVLPPAKAAYVSLRGSASDAAGNRVETTIIRATRLSSL